MYREHLLQLKRQLDNCSIEVSAAKKAIERETLTDSQQILERLQAVESMRQSSITQQVRRLLPLFNYSSLIWFVAY